MGQAQASEISVISRESVEVLHTASEPSGNELFLWKPKTQKFKNFPPHGPLDKMQLWKVPGIGQTGCKKFHKWGITTVLQLKRKYTKCKTESEFQTFLSHVGVTSNYARHVHAAMVKLLAIEYNINHSI